MGLDNSNMYEYDLVVISKVEANGMDVHITKKVEELSGSIVNKQNWGNKNFAYSINKLRAGNYDFFQLKLSPESLLNFKTFLKNENDIIRYLLLKNKSISN